MTKVTVLSVDHERDDTAIVLRVNVPAGDLAERPRWGWFVAGLLVGVGLTVGAFQARAGQEFSREDWMRQGAYTALHAADWMQTRRIAREPQWQELNPILGPKPRQVEVNRYMAGTLVAHWAVSYTLRGEARRLWQEGTIAVEASVVRGNYRLGVGLQF